ncbi:hypothetical protein JYP51_03745 [Ponticoccus gilvus]|nr:hypothetical protein [Enemella evansiae]
MLGPAAFAAGLVRGFSGFGTALVFLPVAAQILSPFGAILALIFMELPAPLPNLRRAWASVEGPDLLARLTLSGFLLLPVGIWVLTRVPPELFRMIVCRLALAMLAALVAGLRWCRRARCRGSAALSGLPVWG